MNYISILYKVEPDFNTRVETSGGATLRLDYYIGLGTTSQIKLNTTYSFKII
jgi:hypothetical protein